MSNFLANTDNIIFESNRLKVIPFNNAFEDPGFLIELSNGVSILFDLGNLTSLSVRQLSRVLAVCVSHTHMDHFFAFDQLIRATLHEKKTFYFFGPAGIAENISHRMQGYLWDLIDRDHFHFMVVELLEGGEKKTFSIKSSDNFAPRILSETSAMMTSNLLPPTSSPAADLFHSVENEFLISAVSCAHSSPCLAFRLALHGRIRFDAHAAKMQGLNLGPWVNESKRLYQAKKFDNHLEISGDSTMTVEDIARKFMVQEVPFTIGYVTDVEFSEHNQKRLNELFHEVDMMLIETNYLNDDHQLAAKNKHLTVSQGAEIARSCGARAARNFHFSKRYKSLHTEENIRSRFDRAFHGY